MLYRYITDSLTHRNICEDIVFCEDPMCPNWTGIPAAFIQVMWHDPEKMETVIEYEYPVQEKTREEP